MRLWFGRAQTHGPVADVSVVIPVYNHERFVRAAIESVLSQTVQPLEILCIDDGSTDGSRRVVEALASQHPTVRLWSRPNVGAHRTINEGIREARGRYVAILNSDDLYHPERLSRCLAVLEDDPGVTGVATEIAFVDESNNAIRFPWYEETHGFYEQVGDLGLALANGNFLMTTSNIVVPRVAFDKIGAFDDLRYAHDLDFFLRLLAYGKRLAVLPEQLLTYRVHGNNTVSQAPLDVKVETAVVVAFFAWRIAVAGDASGYEPRYLSRILEIAERHQLTQLVALALLHAQRDGTGIVSPGSCVADPAFRSEAWQEAKAVPAAVRVPDAEEPVYTPGPPTLAIRRRLLDWVLRRPLARRFFTAVRWRSGLDADLQELSARLSRVAAALDSERGEVVARVEQFESRLATLKSNQAAADAAEGRTVQKVDELAARTRPVGPPRNAAR
jgi:glycosyltransferase involved in cell wall biosynthesis